MTEAAGDDLLLVPGVDPLYGLNTLGGALALSTKSALSHPGIEAELSVTGSGRRRADFATDAQSRRLAQLHRRHLEHRG